MKFITRVFISWIKRFLNPKRESRQRFGYSTQKITLKAKQEQFCKEVASGKDDFTAWRDSGYKNISPAQVVFGLKVYRKGSLFNEMYLQAVEQRRAVLRRNLGPQPPQVAPAEAASESSPDQGWSLRSRQEALLSFIEQGYPDQYAWKAAGYHSSYGEWGYYNIQKYLRNPAFAARYYAAKKKFGAA